MKCEQCAKEFKPTRAISRFCSEHCRKAWHYTHSTRVRNIKEKPRRKQQSGFTYENISGTIMRKPIEDHVWHPQNILKMDDRTSYYRGNGVFGYSDHEAIGYEDESSIE